MNKHKHMDGKSFDNVRARIDELKRLFPEAVKEGRFDPELLVGLLEENDETYGLNDERYDFTWKGKAEALRLAQRRSDGTLRPCLEESRDWDTTQNLYVEGDNLEVMKLLQQGYLRSVKMIYIDPPYNTGNDFVYQDDFADPIAKYKEATGQGMRANPETAGRYHSNWLSMMYPRLKIAKTLLRDDGAIFISVDNNEQHNLRKLCDDVFGEENFIELIVWQKRTSPANDAKWYSSDHEYVMVYARKRVEWYPKRSARTEEQDKYYKNPDDDPRGPWNSATYTCNKSRSERPGLYYPITNPNTGKEVLPDENAVWKFSREKHGENIKEELLYWGADGQAQSPRLKQFLSDAKDIVPRSVWHYGEVGSTQTATTELRTLFGGAAFPYPKPVDLVKKAIYQSTHSGDIILDFFAGSSTTAHAVMQLNSEDGGSRKYIVIQMPELTDDNSEAYKAGYRSITAIGKDRICRAGDKISRASVQSPDTHPPLLSGDGYGDGHGYGNGHGDGQGAGFGAPDGTGNLDKLDIGFRVFKLDSSNLTKWDGSYVPPEEADLFLARAEHSLVNMKPDRRDIDMVYEALLKYGVPLTEKLATLQIRDKTFYVVDDTGYLMICLESGITVEIVEELIKTHTPGTVIFADQCFADDNELTNAGLALDKAQIEFRWI